MDNMPLISVIVPVYKVEKYLQRCVDSIRAQTYRNLEIILVDDGSPDDCGTLCDRFAVQDERIRVIHKENGGLSSARNAGIDIARGEYLGFVDSDDWIEHTMYETLLSAALRENVKLVCGGRYDFSERTGERTVGLCPKREEVISGEELTRRIFTWNGLDSAAWDKLYHRSLFAAIRYPLGRINEDLPVTYKLAFAAGKAAMVSKPLYNYYHRPGSITTAAVSEKVFHYTQNTESVYKDILATCPSLEKEALYLRLTSLGHVLMKVDRSGKQDRERYSLECRALRKELRSHLGFVLTSPLISRKNRILWTLMGLDLYYGVNKLRNFLR